MVDTSGALSTFIKSYSTQESVETKIRAKRVDVGLKSTGWTQPPLQWAMMLLWDYWICQCFAHRLCSLSQHDKKQQLLLQVNMSFVEAVSTTDEVDGQSLCFVHLHWILTKKSKPISYYFKLQLLPYSLSFYLSKNISLFNFITFNTINYIT